MAWLTTILGILQLIVVALLIRETFGIRYDSDDARETRPGSAWWTSSSEEGDASQQRSNSASDKGSRQSRRESGDDNQGVDVHTVDDVAEDEEALRDSFDNLNDVAENLMKVMKGMRNAVSEERFNDVKALAKSGASMFKGDDGAFQLLKRNESVVSEAQKALEDVKQSLQEELIALSDDATVHSMANMHESGVDGLFHSDVEALESIPEDFFRQKVDEYKAASSDAERVEIWKDGYEALSALPQFYADDPHMNWTDPREVEDIVGSKIEYDHGEQKDKLLDDLEKMMRRYEKMKEELPDNVRVKEKHREAEEELNLVNHALQIVANHERLLGETATAGDMGNITVAQDEEDNDVSLRNVGELLMNGFKEVSRAAEEAESSDDVDLSQILNLSQLFAKTVAEAHRALDLYTDDRSPKETMSDLKALAQEIRDENNG
jgi:hypothetical protein